MARILITGAAGFIGSNLADRLLSDGHRVRILDALSAHLRETGLARWQQDRILKNFVSAKMYENGLYCRADDRGDPPYRRQP